MLLFYALPNVKFMVAGVTAFADVDRLGLLIGGIVQRKIK